MVKKPLEKLKFEVQLAAHCNLKCWGCDQFAPLAQKAFADLDIFSQDLNRLGVLFDGDAERIYLVGGEPLLHPDIASFFKVARDAFPHSSIAVITNGLLLFQKDELFWMACKTNFIDIFVTKYPGVAVNHGGIKDKARINGVSLRYFNNETEIKTSYHNPLDISGSLDGSAAFQQCSLANNCIQLREGRLYPCSVVPNVYHFNAFFNMSLQVSDSDSIDIYAARSGREILEFLSNPIPFCRYCNVWQRAFGLPWGRSRKDIIEWTGPLINIDARYRQTPIWKRFLVLLLLNRFVFAHIYSRLRSSPHWATKLENVLLRVSLWQRRVVLFLLDKDRLRQMDNMSDSFMQRRKQHQLKSE